MELAPSQSGRAGIHGWKPILLIAVVLSMLILARVSGGGEKLLGLRDWILSLGPWAPVIYVVVYAAATVAALPGFVLTVAAGAMFGSLLGVVLVSVGSILGASLAFLIARYFARGTVEQWLKGNQKFLKLDEMSRKHGAVIVALTRLVPIFPFNLLNYGLGLTGVRFGTYLCWSWLCMLPGTVLYVVGSDALFRGLAEGRVPWGLLMVFCSVAVLVLVLVFAARKRLGREAGG
jgi:uncharacterized membrane protein YdjX (TVP38/TMEM64 family)